MPPNAPGVQRPKLCKGNCGPDGGIELNFSTNRLGLQWETQVLGHQGASKPGEVQEEDTERDSPPTFLNLLSQHIPVARLLRSSSRKCSLPPVPEERQEKLSPFGHSCLQGACHG